MSGPVHILGMGMSPDDLTRKHLALINSADTLIGGQRLLAFFEDSGARKKVIHKNTREIIGFIRQRLKHKERIVVLCSGDPLFFGLGSLLAKTIGKDQVRVYPNVSAVAAAFARIGDAWQDACVLSFHGRNSDARLLEAAAAKDKIALYTDPVRTPGRIADLLIGHHMAFFEMCVLENLGTPLEKVDWYTLEQAAAMAFDDPNLVILKRVGARAVPDARLHLGLCEDGYAHQRSLITKAEIRAVTLARLALCDHHVLWDLGAGSGSISIEAALLIKSGKIFAVEKDRQRVDQIRQNLRTYNVPNLSVVHAELPEGLEDLETPDRIFIGGGGTGLADIIGRAAECLRADGVMVVNTVLIESLTTALAAFRGLGFKTDTVQVQVSRAQDMPHGQRFAAENPVWIIRGRRRKVENRN